MFQGIDKDATGGGEGVTDLIDQKKVGKKV
jgi:hypothetical protein